MTFHQIGNGIPTDFNSIIFQRGWLKPPTRKCWGTEATGVHVDDFTQKTIDFLRRTVDFAAKTEDLTGKKRQGIRLKQSPIYRFIFQVVGIRATPILASLFTSHIDN